MLMLNFLLIITMQHDTYNANMNRLQKITWPDGVENQNSDHQKIKKKSAVFARNAVKAQRSLFLGKLPLILKNAHFRIYLESCFNFLNSLKINKSLDWFLNIETLPLNDGP